MEQLGGIGPRTIYLNHAATAYPRSPLGLRTAVAVLEAPPDGARHGGRDTLDRYREIVAACVGAEPGQVFFSSGATLAMNQILQGFLQPGDHCVVDNRSHNAVLRTLHNTQGISYSICRLHSTSEAQDPEAVVRCLSGETRLVCLNHVSNVFGSIYDVGEIIDAVHAARPDVAVFVDASQAAGILDLATTLRKADLFSFAGHKHLRSLPGAAVVVARLPLRPILFGGTGHESTRLAVEELGRVPLETGTPNEPAVAALAACLQDATARLHQIRATDDALTWHLWHSLQGVPGLALLGRPPGPDRIGIIACVPEYGLPEPDWVPFLRMQKIAVRGGLHCAPTPHAELGLEAGGTLRLSVGESNTIDEIDGAVEALAEFALVMRQIGERRSADLRLP